MIKEEVYNEGQNDTMTVMIRETLEELAREEIIKSNKRLQSKESRKYLVIDNKEQQMIKYSQVIKQENRNVILKLISSLLLIIIIVIPRLLAGRTDNSREMFVVRRTIKEIIRGRDVEQIHYHMSFVNENLAEMYDLVDHTSMLNSNSEKEKHLLRVTTKSIRTGLKKNGRTFTKNIELGRVRIKNYDTKAPSMEMFIIKNVGIENKNEMTIIIGVYEQIKVIVEMMNFKIKANHCEIIEDKTDGKAILIMVEKRCSIYEYDYIVCTNNIRTMIKGRREEDKTVYIKIAKIIEDTEWKKEKLTLIDNDMKKIIDTKIMSCRVNSSIIATDNDIFVNEKSKLNYIIIVNDGLYIRNRSIDNNVVWNKVIDLGTCLAIHKK